MKSLDMQLNKKCSRIVGVILLLGLIATFFLSLILDFKFVSIYKSSNANYIPFVYENITTHLVTESKISASMIGNNTLIIAASKKIENSYICNNGFKGEINDDYCDCPDGSDEPQTSACSNILVGQLNFDCSLFSISQSRVNDGVCDCPNGSDEWLFGPLYCVKNPHGTKTLTKKKSSFRHLD